MIKSIKKLNCINGSGTFQSEDVMQSNTSGGCRPSQTVIQGKFRANVGTLRGNSGK